MFISADNYLLIANEHYKNKYVFDRNNLEKIISVVRSAIEHNSRVLAFRVEMHLPSDFVHQIIFREHPEYGGVVIKAFFEEFNKLLNLDVREQVLNGKRIRCTDVRYIWAREQTDDAPVPHYHMMIFLSREAYYKLGRFDSEVMNLANKIRMAWHRAVYEENVTIQFCQNRGLVHFPDNAEYRCDKDDEESIRKMLLRAAYLAKNETKRRGCRYRCFGGSNI